ncbi:hypothetical protein PAPYR_3802 [Paratrimastix pyriformis]|uniref:Uncharacterized protein n=1 Tax=Paratrimastix pyriformis TaxID=342808 RepID=A0ABQ8UTL0_9EUKA|nr:hypothetical protein PAPYR_3802 [Paratrimastix pyriformis]
MNALSALRITCEDYFSARDAAPERADAIQEKVKALHDDLASIGQTGLLSKVHDLKEEIRYKDHIIRTVYQEMERTEQILSGVSSKGQRVLKKARKAVPVDAEMAVAYGELVAYSSMAPRGHVPMAEQACFSFLYQDALMKEITAAMEAGRPLGEVISTTMVPPNATAPPPTGAATTAPGSAPGTEEEVGRYDFQAFLGAFKGAQRPSAPPAATGAAGGEEETASVPSFGAPDSEAVPSFGAPPRPTPCPPLGPRPRPWGTKPQLPRRTAPPAPPAPVAPAPAAAPAPGAPAGSGPGPEPPVDIEVEWES